MSTCDETSVKNIVDRKKTAKRRRKKPARFDENSSSERHTDDSENIDDKKYKGENLDDLEKAKFPSFNYNRGDGIETTELLDDAYLETHELDYGNFFDEPPHPDYKQSKVTSKPVISKVEIAGIEEKSTTSIDKDCQNLKPSKLSKPIIRKIETVAIPGIGGNSTTSIDKDCQNLKSLSQHNLGEIKHLNNPESKPTTSHVVGSQDNITNQNVHVDGKSGGGFSTTKESFTTPRASSLPRTINSIDHVNDPTLQSLESHNCCRGSD